jgi:hypothetical protein
MTTSLIDIRSTCEQTLEEVLTDEKVIKWCNIAQADFMLRIFIPGSTTLTLDTTTLSYTLTPTTIRAIRRLRLQTDITNHINRPYNPVYTFYNGHFEVPAPFTAVDTLLIDYYAYLKTFTTITDTIDLDDRFKPLYTSYIESQYYLLPSTIANMPGRTARYVPWLIAYQQHTTMYESMKKQVTDFYTTSIGTQKASESGW